jgi:hypothetical protein
MKKIGLDGLYYYTTYTWAGQDTARNYNTLISASVHYSIYACAEYTETKCVSESYLRPKEEGVLM